MKLNYPTFESNNWLKVDGNYALDAIEKAGGAIWLTKNGDVAYKLAVNEAPIQVSGNKAKIVLSNLIDDSITILNSGNRELKPDIGELDLKLVANDEFNPHKMHEFYKVGALHARNTFAPSQYMLGVNNNLTEPTTILRLIKHLVNNNEQRAKWFINWLALFYQSLQRSQVSLLLRGPQGAGKGIFFDEIIKPLFGETQTIQINDKSLQAQFLGGLIEDRLFYNLDEVQHDLSSNKKIKNFLKALVTNNGIILEKKHQNMESETKLFGQVLITTNEPYSLEIEPSDRRFTVYTTGEKLQSTQWLGHGSYHAMSNAIKLELESFSNYLYHYETNTELANTAQNTEEKEALVGATTDRFQLFSLALKNKDLMFFQQIQEEDAISPFKGAQLFNELTEDFQKNRINKSCLKELFSLLYDEDISSKTLLNKLRVIEPMIFHSNNESKSNGKRFFKI